MITALCILIGLIGAGDNSPEASTGNQFALPPPDANRPIPIALLASPPFSARPSITGIPAASGKPPLAVANRAAVEPNPEPINREATAVAGGAKSPSPQFATAASVSGSDKIALTGRVVDTDGNPIAGFPIAVGPLMSFDGKIMPMFSYDWFRRDAQPYTFKSDTDEEGRFSISGIKPGPLQFMAQPNPVTSDDMPPHSYNQDNFVDAEVLSIDTGAMTFYADSQQPPPHGGITFTIEPGTHVENFEIEVKPRMRIRGQVVFTDGTPLAKAKVLISVRWRPFGGEGTGSSGGLPRTDDAGYFVHYVNPPQPGFYAVAVEFQGLSVTSEQFALETGQRHDDLVITLDSPPIPIVPTPDSAVRPDRDGAWVMNPENGHAYRSIHCESWEDALAKAITEDAYLVSINGASEQSWLVKVFGTEPYWIGLTDFEKGGEWRWSSGELTTYTNWAPNEPTESPPGEEDYVFMGLNPNGNWFNVGPESPRWRMPQKAIIERQGLTSPPPIEDD